VLRRGLLRLVFAAVCSVTFLPASAASDVLFEGFVAPPESARPRVWWHWMNGNVTEAGIQRDLEWMKRIGIGGVQQFDGAFVGWNADFDTPAIVGKPLLYLSPEWRRAMRFSVQSARELGLEFSIASSPGWTLTGGPWVKPHEAMKKLVWSETWIEGGTSFQGRLPKPPDTTGSFQNIPLTRLEPHPWRGAVPTYYADVATIAYRAPESEGPPAKLQPTVTTSAGPVEGERLFDGDLARTIPLPFGEGRYAWIQLAFPQARRVHAFTTVIDRADRYPVKSPGTSGWFEASDDGRVFRKIADLPKTSPSEGNALEQTVAFAPVAARVFRLVLERNTNAPGAHQVAELALQTGGRVNRFEDKAGYSTRQINDADDTPAIASEEAIKRNEIIDLTSRVSADGALEWTPPPGQWVVVRFGYSLTGRINEPAPHAGTGLEVDKLHREYVKRYMDAYLGNFEQTLGSQLMGRRGLRYVVTDSYEAGPQNWTVDMLEQFEARRGYDLRPWLPVLAGRIVESAAASDRLLWDFRATLGELLVDAHFAQISASLHERGLGRYGESQEYRRHFVGDGMAVKKTADIPMGAMWATPREELRPMYEADIRESASVAHVYGRKLVAAESFTAGGNTYAFAPEHLKPMADRMMALGVNRFAIHTSVHQPDDRPGPGIGLGPIGQWFTRKETWAEQAGAWVAYLTRSSYLLQQGRFVADIAYLYGEDANVTSLFSTTRPDVPEGYSYDFINSDALMNECSVRDGGLVTRSGMQYRVLALDKSTRRMTVPVLRKIRQLVRAGASVAGDRPVESPSLADDENEFREIVAELWGSERGARTDRSLEATLRSLQVAPDLEVPGQADAKISFLHRALDDGDLYFISSSNEQPRNIEVSFRVTGRKPELWRADQGVRKPLSYRTTNGRTIVPLRLDANDAAFVVLRQKTSEPSTSVPEPTTTASTALDGPWDVSFPPGLGAPAHAHFESLASWTASANDGIKYFSGTATYSRAAKIPDAWISGHSRVWIDLGEVKNLAEVVINGRSLGVLWKSPFRADITDALRAGDNRLEIKVSNLWPNRLIGDAQVNAHKIAFATYDPFKAGSPLLTSGLMGPVTLSVQTESGR
jgi:hypothetical protein